MWGFGGGDCASIVDMERDGHGGVEDLDVVESVSQTVRVQGYVEGRNVLGFPCGGCYEFLPF